MNIPFISKSINPRKHAIIIGDLEIHTLGIIIYSTVITNLNL